MDQTWMNASHMSFAYEEDVEKFLKFIFERSQPDEDNVVYPKDNVVIWFCSLYNRPDNYLKGIIIKSIVFCNTFILSLVFDINILIVQYACMFLLISVLTGFNNDQGSKSKVVARGIVVKVNHLNNVWCLKNYILLLCTVIFR